MAKYKFTINVLLQIALATWFMAPGLFGDQTFGHGDNLRVGLPFLQHQGDLLREGGNLLWTDLLYGGHPLLAEGQAGFTNPLHIIVALLFPPHLGYNLLHWLSIVLSGVATYGLCRTLGSSFFSANFGSLAVSGSLYYLNTHTNLVFAEAAMWAPISIWAFECWRKKLSLSSAVLFGGSIAMAILVGYPQIFHGVIIYILFLMLGAWIHPKERLGLLKNFKRFFTGGTLAVVVCIGLAAVQWIPLLELAGYSHRNDGVDIIWPISNGYYLRGAIFSVVGADDQPLPIYFPSISSLLVCFLGSLVVIFSVPSRVLAHAIAAFVLFNLGMAPESPIFSFVYEYHLIPGLHNFRIMHPYMALAIIGLAVTAAFVIDAVREQAINFQNLGKVSWKTWLITVFVALGWLSVLYKLHIPGDPWVNHIVTLIAAILIVGTFFAKIIRKNIGALLLIAIFFEVTILRLVPYNFVDNEKLSLPRSMAALSQHEDLADYKHVDASHALLMAFRSPYAGDLDVLAENLFSSLAENSNVIWGIPNLGAGLALPMYRQTVIEGKVLNELLNPQARKVGLRYMDRLSVRFISVNPDFDRHGYSTAYESKKLETLILENQSAKPRFQLYYDAHVVGNLEEAIETLDGAVDDRLVIETSSYPINKEVGTLAGNDLKKASLDVVEAKAGKYSFKITSEKPGWLFISDANYAGWRARVNGSDEPVYTAQVLGKAVQFPEGSSEIEVYFRPLSVFVGLSITIVTLLAVMMLLVIKFTSEINIKKVSVALESKLNHRIK